MTTEAGITLAPALQHLLGRGDVALSLIGAGMLLIILECNLPGRVLPGCAGVLLLLAGIFPLSAMPVRASALAIVLAGVAMLLLELRWPFRGVLLVSGIGVLTGGLWRLVAAPAPAAVSLPTAIVAGLVLGGTTYVLARVALLARRNKFVCGPAGMRGKLASAWTPLEPNSQGEPRTNGRVEVAGELWPAVLVPGASAACVGQTVVVRSVSGRTLLVELAAQASGLLLPQSRSATLPQRPATE